MSLIKYVDQMLNNDWFERDLLEPFFRPLFSSPFNGYERSQFTTKLDGNNYIIRGEVPGFADNEINVEVLAEQGVIKVSGTSEKSDEKNSIFSSESFSRVFSIPKQVENIEKISAEYQKGILAITIPLKENEVPATRQIPIKKIE